MRRLFVLLLAIGLPAVAAAKPDLVITGITIDPASPEPGKGAIAATFKNIGPDDVDSGTFSNVNWEFFLDGTSCDSGSLFFDLGAGEEAIESTGNCNSATPGPHVIKVVVDTGSIIDEANEGNNTLEKTFTWTGSDLVITAITLDPVDAGAGSGTLTATVKNVGAVTAGGLTTVINLIMYLDGEECATGQMWGGIAAGDEAFEETGSCNPSTPGEHTIRFEVDTGEDIPETNEANNFLEKKFTWSGPDLIVKSIVADPVAPKKGDAIKFTATLANQGPYGTATLVNINLRMELDGQECDTGWLTFGLGAGKEATEETTKCVPTTEGPHTIVFFIDTDDDVPETNETNNSLALIFTVGAGPLGAELCNGKDDDANGQTDEGFTVGQDCDGDDADKCKTGKGACSTDGKSVMCTETGEAKVELCNAKDEDCDGKTDEDFAELGKACTPAGGCGTGTNVCTADGKGLECKSSGSGSAKETCNGKDDDCDGDTDEDFPELGAACSAGVGSCQIIGKFACSQGKATCNATPKAAGAEKADGMDNDCDGATDEGAPCSPGSFLACGQSVGNCALGIQKCTAAGTLSATCEGSVAAKAEVCGNDVDEDCDGTIDEGCTCTASSKRPCSLATGCGAGTQTCGGGSWSACAPTALVAEVCGNAKDDDCDEEVDDGCPCSGSGSEPCEPKDACASYARTCEAGALSPCEPVPGTEVAGCGGGTPVDTDTSPSGSDTSSTGGDAGGIIIGPGTDPELGTPTVSETIAGGDSGCSQTSRSGSAWPIAAFGLLALALWRRRRAAR
jgi:MYXO-CTERM domain-containing protein